MEYDHLISAIHQLEKLETEQERELSQTREMILTLKKRAGWAAQIPLRALLKAREAITGGTLAPKETYGSLCKQFLKEHGGPMHVKLIVKKLNQYKGVDTITRPSVQTALNRLVERSQAIRKVGPGKFQYFEAGNGHQ